MVSRTCDQCGATVAADEQFCPTCGAFIDPMTPTRRPSSRRRATGTVITVTSSGASGGNQYEEFSLKEPPGEEATPTRVTNGDDLECPSCGSSNPATNRHCQHCGARLRQGPLPTAPRPAVQATAGVRAALAISGLLLLVIVAALLFNVFGGDPATSTTIAAATSTTGVPEEPAVIEVIRADCDPPGIGTLSCINLVSGQGSEYQVNWEELETAERALTISFAFRQPMVVTRIDWNNIDDETRFKQNYRARGLTISSNTSLTEVVRELLDEPGLQMIEYAAMDATTLTITVQSAYGAEVIEGDSFPELAIDEITIWGRPAP